MKVFKKIQFSYLLALFLLCVVAAFSGYFIIDAVRKQDKDATVVNAVGRQRMRLQRLAKISYMLVYHESIDSARRKQTIRDMKKVLENFEKTQQHFIRRDSDSIKGQNSEDVNNLYREMQPSHDTLTQVFKDIYELVSTNKKIDPALVQPLFTKISHHDVVFLEYLERVVALYVKESKEKIEFTINVIITAVSIFFALIVVQIFFIFRPLSLEIGRLFEQLEQKNKEIENSAEEMAVQKAEIEKQNAFQQAILENSALMIITTTTEGLITTFNPAAEKALCYHADELVSKLSPAVFHDLDQVAQRAEELSEEFHEKIEVGFDVFVYRTLKGLPNTQEWTYIRKNGERFPVNLSITALRQNEQIIGFIGIAEDITERKRQEELIQQQHEELQSSEEELWQNVEELQTLQETLASALSHNMAITAALDNSVIVSIADLRGTITKINPIFCKISGYTEDELLGQNHRIVNSGYHPKSFWVEMWKTISKGKTWRAEVCNRNKDGELYWVDTVINPVYDVTGKFYQYLSIRTLITERKKAEKALQQNFEELQTTQESLLIAQHQAFIKSRLVESVAISNAFFLEEKDWKKAILKSFEVVGRATALDRGYYFESHIDKQSKKILVSQKLEWVAEGINSQMGNPNLQNISLEEDFPEIADKLLQNEVYQAVVSQLPEGNLKTTFTEQEICAVFIVPIFIEKVFFGFIGFDECQDEKILSGEEIATLQTLASNLATSMQRQRAEESLLAQKNYSEALLAAIPDLVFVFDAQGTFLEYKAGNARELAMPPAMFLGKKLEEVLPPSLAVPMQEKISAVFRDKASQNLEYQMLVEEGLLDFEARFSAFGADRVITMVHNISERKKTEQEILKQQEMLLRVGEIAKVGGWEYDLVQNKITWDKIIYDIHELPYTFEPTAENTVAYHKEGENREKGLNAIENAIEKGENYDLELQMITATGKEIWVRNIGEPVFKDGKCVKLFGVLQDITEQKLADEAIAQSEAKLQSVLNEVQDVIWSVRLPDYKMRLVTPSAEILYGHSVEEWMQDSSIWEKVIHPEDRSVVGEIFDSLEKKGFFDKEYRIITKQGQVKWVQNKAKIVFDKNSKPIRLDGAVTDITQRKKAEAQILKSQQDLLRVGQIAKVGGWEYDVVQNKIVWDKIIYDIHELPYTFEPTVESVVLFYKEGESRDKIVLAIADAMSHSIDYDLELQLITATGKEIWVRALGMSEFKDGKCVKLFGVFQDITEQKLADEKILASQKQLQSFFDLNLDFMTIVSPDGYLETFNPSFERELGHSREELSKYPFKHWIHPEDIKKTAKETVKLSQGFPTIDFENRHRKKDGEYIWLSWRAVIDPKTGKRFATARNITAVKKAEKLTELNLILKDRPNISELGTSNYFDNVLKGLLDLTESEYGFLGEVFYENDQPYLKTYVLTNIAWNEKTKQFYEEHAPKGLEFRNLDTLFGYALKHKELVISNNPKEDPRSSDLPAGDPALNTFMGIPIIDAQGLLIGMIGLANKKAGYKEADAEFLGIFLDSFANIIQTFQAERKRLIAEFELQKQNEKLLSSEEELKQNMEELASQRDYLNQTLEELKHSQEQIIRSEKLAVMGKLVASVAHEINTPLGAIQASTGNIAVGLQEALLSLPKIFQILTSKEQKLFFEMVDRALQNKNLLSSKEERQARKKLEADLLELQIPKAEELAYKLSSIGFYENLADFVPLFQHAEAELIVQIATQLINQNKSVRTIQTAIEKASKVVFALKTYARHDHNNAKIKAKISESLETVLTLYHGQMKHSIEVERHYEETPEVWCYVEELNQVWTNLIHNALQAMDNKGKLFVGVRPVGSKIEVSIKDTGKGIPKAIQDKVFEAFFTTKPAGEGSGLGLDIVRKIVEKHEGKIWFETEEGVGTTFFVQIPIEE